MSKKIVVFGPDNSGKTTLATTIAKECNVDYIHSPGPLDAEGMLYFIKANLLSEQDLVFDRFAIIEEMTCGKVLRGKDKFEELYDSGKADRDNLLSKIDLFIFCLPPIENVKNWGEREQMNGIKENIDNLIDSYKEVADYLYTSGYPILRYDYTKDKVEDVIDVIERMK